MPDGEFLDVLSDDGLEVIGTAERARVHADGLPHRAVHVLVFSSGGCLLMQRRSARKATHPGAWDTSVGGHVDAGESALAAALREASEELGVRLAPDDLRESPSHRVAIGTDVEHVRSWETVHDGPFVPDPAEVETVAWFDRDQLEELVASGGTTPHFAIQWRAWLRDRMSGRSPSA